MDVFTAVADRVIKILDIIAWPATFLILMYWFQSEVGGIIRRLSNFKYKDLEANFESELEKAEAEAETATSELQKVRTKERTDTNTSDVDEPLEYYIDLDQYLEVATVSPRASILVAWPALEKAVSEAASRLGMDFDRMIRPHQKMKKMNESGAINQEILSSFNRLRQLRNEAAHITDLEITTEEAERYILILSRILGYLNEIGRY